MNVTVSKTSLVKAQTDAVLAAVFEGEPTTGRTTRDLDEACGGLLTRHLQTGDFQAKAGQTSVLYDNRPARLLRIIVVGLGKRKTFNLDLFRSAIARAAQQVRSLRLNAFAMDLDSEDLEMSSRDLAEAAVEGALLGLYQFTACKTVDLDQLHQVREMVLCEENRAVRTEIMAGAEAARMVCDAVLFTRDLVSMPGNRMTPSQLALAAEGLCRGRKSLTCRILDDSKMKKLGMNALLGVARGSDEPPRFIILEYRGGKKSDPSIVLIGKGLTFDSGGISLKPADKMDEMKTDMAGAAAVLGALRAAADLKLPLNLIGLAPTTENLPSGKAYKPGDVLVSMSGLTIEVLNTDAEGRLVLADALTYAGRYKPAAIIDLATLTGGCVIALGERTIGMLGTNDALKEQVRSSGERTGERVWELPLWDDYLEMIKSDVADYKNSAGRPASTITAAAFLSKFVGEYPWVHLDIAGPAWMSKERPYIPKGASGIGVRLLIDFLRHWQGNAG